MSKRILVAIAALLALTAGVASANAKPVHNRPAYQYYDYAPGYQYYGYYDYAPGSYSYGYAPYYGTYWNWW
jgi:hypothetical protein